MAELAVKVYRWLGRVARRGDCSAITPWSREVARTIHEPIVRRELWDRVQDLLDGKHPTLRTRAKRDFAFTGLVRCGHCGCSLVAEIKKGKYVYYHCSGHKGRCGEPYVREEVLEERFAGLLKALSFDDEVLEWARAALRASHMDERQFHDEAITRLQDQYNRLQGRIDAMYVDKLDGKIEAAFYERMSAKWRSEQDECLRSIEEHQAANRTYLDEGIQLLELAQNAHRLFKKQEPREKRRLLGFVVSNCSWKDGALTATYRQPFDLLAKTTAADTVKRRTSDRSHAVFCPSRHMVDGMYRRHGLHLSAFGEAPRCRGKSVIAWISDFAS